MRRRTIRRGVAGGGGRASLAFLSDPTLISGAMGGIVVQLSKRLQTCWTGAYRELVSPFSEPSLQRSRREHAEHTLETAAVIQNNREQRNACLT